MILISNSIHAQTKTPPRPAEFPGGINQFYKWVDRNIIYPKDALLTSTEGQVVISFILNESGKVWGESLTIKQSVSPTIDAEAIRLMKESPIWIPARDAELGKAVPVRMSVPINFMIPEALKVKDK